MSGHSKWHNIRLRKGAQDAKRGALFTKIAKEIIMAARAGGASQDTNLRLRMAVQKARENSMPMDNIQRNIKRGTGELDGVTYEEITYEGYGPGGVAVMVECATDNKQRTVSNVRAIFGKNGGNLGESGSVAYRFRQVGLFAINKSVTDEDTVFAVALDAGAEDVRSEDDHFVVVTQPEDFGSVRDALEAAKIPTVSSDYTMEPTDTVALEGKDAETMIKLLDLLEDNEDVQNVHANFDIPDDMLKD